MADELSALKANLHQLQNSRAAIRREAGRLQGEIDVLERKRTEMMQVDAWLAHLEDQMRQDISQAHALQMAQAEAES